MAGPPLISVQNEETEVPRNKEHMETDVRIRELVRVPLRSQGHCGLEGPLGTPVVLVLWKRASSRVEAGTSGFLSISDSDCRVPADLGQDQPTLQAAALTASFPEVLLGMAARPSSP